jgi:hypothetical protein
MLGLQNKKARYLQDINIYVLSNQDAVADVLSRYGENAPPTGEAVMLAVVVYGDDFIYDLYDATSDGDNLPAEDEQGFCDFWHDAVNSLEGADGAGPRSGRRIMGVRHRHWIMIIIGIVVIIVAVVLWRKYGRKLLNA